MKPKQVPGFENLYLNENGTPYQMENGKLCQLPVSSTSTYDRVSVLVKGKKVRYHIHVLMAITFLGLDLTQHGIKGMSLQVDHKDNDKRNNSIGNLEVVTKRENFNRALKSGLYSKNGYASKGKAKPSLRKFTAKDVEHMKELRNKGLSYRKIAEEFNCNHLAIYQILKGTTYQDLS